jgi:hypothetical protein
MSRRLDLSQWDEDVQDYARLNDNDRAELNTLLGNKREDAPPLDVNEILGHSQWLNKPQNVEKSMKECVEKKIKNRIDRSNYLKEAVKSSKIDYDRMKNDEDDVVLVNLRKQRLEGVKESFEDFDPVVSVKKCVCEKQENEKGKPTEQHTENSQIPDGAHFKELFEEHGKSIFASRNVLHEEGPECGKLLNDNDDILNKIQKQRMEEIKENSEQYTMNIDGWTAVSEPDNAGNPEKNTVCAGSGKAFTVKPADKTVLILEKIIELIKLIN